MSVTTDDTSTTTAVSVVTADFTEKLTVDCLRAERQKRIRAKVSARVRTICSVDECGRSLDLRHERFH